MSSNWIDILPRELETEFTKAKLRKYDVRFHGGGTLTRGQSQQPPGPLVQKFRSYEFLKLVAGPWGDLSQDFHMLLKTFAEKRVENMARGRGVESGAGELGKVMGEVRRAMSVEVVRSNALCLLERLAFLSPGARAAGERRSRPTTWHICPGGSTEWGGDSSLSYVNVFGLFFYVYLHICIYSN